MIDLDALHAMNKRQHYTPHVCRVCINPHTYVTIMNFPYAPSYPVYNYPMVKVEK